MPDVLTRNSHDRFTAENEAEEALKEHPFFLEIISRMYQRKDLPEAGEGGAEIFRITDSDIPESFKRLIPKDNGSNWLRSVLNRHMKADPALKCYEVDDSLPEQNNVAQIFNFIYKIRSRKRGSITETPTPISKIEALVHKLRTKPVADQKRALLALEKLEKKRWVDKLHSKPTADFVVPDAAPNGELWEASDQKSKVDAGAMSMDEAIPSFTLQVYKGLLPGECPVGLAMSDFSSIDPPLYEEWKAFRKRLNTKNTRKAKSGRPETPWDESWPFQSPAARTDFILEQLQSGEMLPPQNHRAYLSLRGSISKRHGLNIDKYLPEGRYIE